MKQTRANYAGMFGPTTGDQVRLADTEIFIEVERDLIAGADAHLDECVRDSVGKLVELAVTEPNVLPNDRFFLRSQTCVMRNDRRQIKNCRSAFHNYIFLEIRTIRIILSTAKLYNSLLGKINLFCRRHLVTHFLDRVKLEFVALFRKVVSEMPAPGFLTPEGGSCHEPCQGDEIAGRRAQFIGGSDLI